MPAPRLRPSPRLALFGALVALSTPAARGQGCEAVDLTGVLQLNQTWAMNRIWIHPQTNPPGEYDRIGRSVDVCGRVCAVGVPMFDWPEHTGGEREDSGWASWMTIHPSESMVYNDEFPPTSDWFIPTEGDEAGFDVSLDESPGGDYTFRYAFSLPGTNGQRGRVCITHLGERCPGTLGYPSDWMYMALEAPDASPNDRFGHSIAIDGKVLVAGAPQDDDLGSASGSAYVFRGNELEAKLLASDGEAFDRFGDSVALDGDLVLVGAPRHDQSRGAVYVYTRDSSGNWYQEARLTAWDAGVADTFGQEVALHDGWAVIGAPWDDDGANGAGAAYVFERVGQEWEPRGKIVAYDAVSYGNFGTSVDTDQGRVLVGAPNALDGDGTRAGKAYLYELDAPGGPGSGEWILQRELGPGLPASKFGASVALDDRFVAVGAPEATLTHLGEYPEKTGWTHVFDLGETTRVDALWPFAFRTDHRGARVRTPESYLELRVRVHDLDQYPPYDTAAMGDPMPGTPATSYELQWFRDGIDLADNSRISGAATARLYVRDVRVTDEGRYELRGADAAAPNHGLCTGDVFAGPFDVVVREGPIETVDEIAAPPSGGERVGFGSAVATDGDRLVVGAPGDDDWGPDAGAAYVWRREGDEWQFELKLHAPDGAAFDEFGDAVAVAGDLIVVGAPRADAPLERSGAVYIYRFDGSDWSFDTKRTATVPEAYAGFGAAVAATTDRIIVGSPSAGPVMEGAAFVFEERLFGWELVYERHATTPLENFGWSVDANDHRVAIGAPGAHYHGQVHVVGAYTRFSDHFGDVDRWGTAPVWPPLGVVLESPQPAPGARFGASVALEADYLLVGSPSDDRRGFDAGAVHRFDLDVRTMTFEDGVEVGLPSYREGGRAGCSLAADGDVYVVGAASTDGQPDDAGAAFLYTRGLYGRFVFRDALGAGSAGGDRFGGALAIAGQVIWLGAEGTDSLGTDSGSATLFDL